MLPADLRYIFARDTVEYRLSGAASITTKHNMASIAFILKDRQRYPWSDELATMSILSDGTTYRGGALLLCSQAQDPQIQAVGFWAVGRSLASDDVTIFVNAKNLTQIECYMTALGLDPNSSYAWGNLGDALAVGESIVVNGKSCTDKDCFVTAVGLDPKNAIAWGNLGFALAAGESIVVNGKSFSKKDCYATALGLDPKLAIAWVNLGFALAAGESILVNGKRFTKQECLENGK